MQSGHQSLEKRVSGAWRRPLTFVESVLIGLKGLYILSLCPNHDYNPFHLLTPQFGGGAGGGYLVSSISSIGAVAVYCCASRWKGVKGLSRIAQV